MDSTGISVESTNLVLDLDIWTLFYYTYKYSKGVGVGCLIINPPRKRCFVACRLGFYNTTEYEAFIQGFKKCIDLGVRSLKKFLEIL